MAHGKVLGKLPWLLALALTPPVGAADGETRYVVATVLNVRAQPVATAAVQTRLKINQPVTLLNTAGRWCEITVAGLERPGYTDCQYLARQTLTQASIETETADLILKLNQLAARHQSWLPSESIDWRSVHEKSPAEFLRIFEQLFQQYEKHFALSPSLQTYVDYQELLSIMSEMWQRNDKPVPAQLEALRKARTEQLPTMCKALTTDFSGSEAPPVRRAITTTLIEVLRARQAARYAATPAQKPEPSFFRDGRWAVGWAGGPLASRMKKPLGQGVAYRIRFDGYNAGALAGVYEMAKAHRTAVGVTFSDEGGNGVLSSKLTVWGVTDKGLVKGQLLRVSYGGGACSDNSETTSAELVFPEPVTGTLHAAFISSAPIDPAQVRVTLKRRTWLEPLQSDETTFSHRIQAEIDLDGDGVPDLRTTIKNDHSVSQWNGSQLTDLSGPAWHGWQLRPVGGWYENNIYQLEIYEDGRWRSLSLYNLVTCT